MINKVEQFLINNNLTSSNNPIVVAFSGGFDSMCLLDILHKLSTKYNFTLCAAHLNHGWRAEAADKDEQNCKNFCQAHAIKFYTERLSSDIPKTETAAREARYEFFEKAAKYFNTNIVMTAHNKSDNAETILYRITKGTGVTGLQGIEKIRQLNNVFIYRPLLFVERKEIEEYCKKNKLSPNNDMSNFDTKYKRNHIRHKIIPMLSEINKDVINSLNSLCENARMEENIVNEYLTKIKKDIINNGKINTSKFLKQSAAVQQRLIYEEIRNLGLDYNKKKITDILVFIKKYQTSQTGKSLSLTNELFLFVSNKEIYTFYLNKKADTELTIATTNSTYDFDNYSITVTKNNKPVKEFPKDSEYIAYVDLSNFNELQVRYRNNGDIIQPFSHNSTIKLKDYFISKKIPKHQRDNIVLLCKGKEVLWVVGIGLSEKLRVKNNPTHIIELKKD